MFVPAQRSTYRLVLASMILPCLGGCREAPQVTRQVVPKPEAIQLSLDRRSGDRSASATADQPGGPPTHRMLAAVAEHKDTAWFIKGIAPLSEVGDSLTNEFERVVRSIDFDTDQGDPTWDLPAGWSQVSGDGGMRFATLRREDVAFSVIPLPAGEDWQQYLLANLNRWRGQLALPPIGLAEMTQTTRQVPLADGKEALLVDLTGWDAADTARRPLADSAGPAVAKGEAGDGTGPIPVTARPASDPPRPSLEYDTPSGWRVSPAGQFSSAAFGVEDGPQRVEVTVTALGGTAGGLLANVNRWREQVGLSPVKSMEAIEQQPVEIDGQRATYVTLAGPGGQTILAAVVAAGERSWFFKLAGDHDLALREEDRFRQFLQSVRLPHPPQ